MARRRSKLPADLAQAAERFASWRENRTTHRIPEELWSLAIDLAQKHGVCPCARATGLNYALVKDRLNRTLKGPRSQTATKPPTFLEVIAPRPQSGCVLETVSGCGKRLRLELQGSSAEGIAALLRALWKSES